tara:strand:+ start:1005 stop:1208 length:204 start_codon:yes stop_codon:yes gene_type:complete
MFEQLKERAAALNLSKKEYKKMRRAYKNELVHRSALKKIVAAWAITVPTSALMSATIYYFITGIIPN